MHSLHISLGGPRYLGTVYPHGIFVLRTAFIALAYPQDKIEGGDDNGKNDSQKLVGGFESRRCAK
jgi:hypothetical protein